MANSLRDRIAGMPIYPDMEGKVAFITGGSRGIGLATAGAFARQGVKVVIASRREATAKTALKQLSTLGDVQWLSVDAADGKSVARLMDSIMNKHGRLDYAFNNGGSGGRLAPVAKMTEEAWRKTIDGYLTSVFLCMNAEIAAMKEHSTSVIVNNASVDGLRGYPFAGGAAYSERSMGSSVSLVVPHLSMLPRDLAFARSPQVGSTRHRSRIG